MKNEEKKVEDSRILRLNAEEKLRENEKTGIVTDQDTDVKRLLHELQVHQIELEMQNEELREANETAETALKKYTMLYDFSPIGYLTLDSSGIICDLNFTAAEMLHEKRFSLIDINFSLFVPTESRVLFNNFLKLVFESNKKESCKIMLGYENAPSSFVYLEGIVTGEERRCLLAAVDISDFTWEKEI